jgi:hypothetical protein
VDDLVALTADQLSTLAAAALVLVATTLIVLRIRRSLARRAGCGCETGATAGCPASSRADEIRRAARRATDRA